MRTRPPAAVGVTLLAALAAAGGCGEASAPSSAGDEAPAPAPPAGGERVSAPVRGIGVTLPAGWRRAARSLTPRLASPLELISVGTGPFPPQPAGCNHMPGAALDAMGPRGAFLSIQEIAGGDPRDVPRQPPRTEVLSLDRPPVRGWVCSRSPDVRVWWIPFRDGERSFSALAALGPRATPARRRELERTLASVRADAGRTVADRGLRLRVPAGWEPRLAAAPRGPARLRVAAGTGEERVRVTVTHLRPGRAAPAPGADCAGARACAVKRATLRGWRLRVVVAVGTAGDATCVADRLPPRPDPARDARALRSASDVLATLHTEFSWPPPR